MTAILAKMREVLAALEAFALAAGDLPFVAEPAAASDRRFVVEATGAALAGPRWGNGYRQQERDVAVRVRYDSRHDLDALEDRMASDADAVVSALEAPAARAADCLLVECTGIEPDRTDAEFPTQTLTFRATYLVAL